MSRTPHDPAAAQGWSAASAYTAEEALAMDDWLVRERGFTITQLMAVAGARVAQAARALIRERGLSRVVCLVGPGNNGGDALVAEGLLRTEIETLLWQPLPRSPAADGLAAAADSLAVADHLVAAKHPAADDRDHPPRTTAAPALEARMLVVDGLFGVGLARPLDGAASAAVEHVRASAATVLAIDIPSGLCASTGVVLGGVAPQDARSGRSAIRAHVTLTFVGPKRGFFLDAGPGLVGAWRAVDIGFPPEDAHAWLARRRAGESAL